MSSENDTTDDTEQIKDPEEYVQNRRLADIFDARQEFRDHRLAVLQTPTEERWEAVSAYRAAVSNYVTEVEPLMTRYDPGPDYLNRYEFGTVTVGLDTETHSYRHGADRTIVRVPGSDTSVKALSVPEPAEYDVVGLRSLFELPDPITHTFEVETDAGLHASTQTRHLTTRAQIPFRILDEMARATHLFLAEVGFELDPEEASDQWEI